MNHFLLSKELILDQAHIPGNGMNEFCSSKVAIVVSRSHLGGRGSRRADGSMRVPTTGLSGSFALPNTTGPTKNVHGVVAKIGTWVYFATENLWTVV